LATSSQGGSLSVGATPCTAAAWRRISVTSLAPVSALPNDCGHRVEWIERVGAEHIDFRAIVMAVAIGIGA